MTQFNIVAGSILQSSQAMQRQLSEKTRQVERAQNLGKNIAIGGDDFEHQVESADELSGAGDAPDRGPNQQRDGHADDQGSPHADEEPTLDVRA